MYKNTIFKIVETYKEGKTKQIKETSKVKFNLPHVAKMQGDIFLSAQNWTWKTVANTAGSWVFCFKLFKYFWSVYVYYVYKGTLLVWLPARFVSLPV